MRNNAEYLVIIAGEAVTETTTNKLWFELLEEITRLPMVEELIALFGLLPISMAALLGEKERAAAFAAVHPLACIDLCPPVIASVPADVETIFGYDCTTKNSYMLRVVNRGYMKEKSTWYGKRAEFVQHGQLALLKQAFPSFFRLLPVGLHLTAVVDVRER